MTVTIKYKCANTILSVVAQCSENKADHLYAGSFDEDGAYFSIGRGDVENPNGYHDVVLTRADTIKFCRVVLKAIGCEDEDAD
jgi:hypothetical protein